MTICSQVSSIDRLWMSRATTLVGEDYESSKIIMTSVSIDYVEWIMDYGFSLPMKLNC